MSAARKSSSFLRNFVPFCGLVVVSFVGLAQFRKVNYKYKVNDSQFVFKEQLTQSGMSENDYQAKSTPSRETEYAKMLEKVDINSWQNIRGPRPWEDSKKIQNELKKKD